MRLMHWVEFRVFFYMIVAKHPYVQLFGCWQQIERCEVKVCVESMIKNKVRVINYSYKKNSIF